ncbi:dipeptidase [Novosphingobium sp.]|uniref:dipeptidase n=1 Tax=Novosphingobium sp. TaxID=1874826 RepID=UPI0025CE9854|nr:dipeptidase [Novosphingobium sp.]
MRSITLAATVLVIALAHPAMAQTPEQTAAAALKAAPVWDGHNDVPEQLRERRKNVLSGFDFRDTLATGDATKGIGAMHTDLKRLRAGKVGAQFWSVYVSAGLSEPQAVQATLEQIDVMKRIIARYPAEMQFCTDSACVDKAMKSGKVASLLGMEGGHSIGGSLAVLRQMHALGARYMTLTHFKNLAWAESATDAPMAQGLTPFGKDVVREMQRLGVLVDLSHVSEKTMIDALDVAGAPVIFSHSGAQGIDGHPRNVSDRVLKRMAVNGGIVMVNTAPAYVSETVRSWIAARIGEEERLKAIHIGNPDAALAGRAAWIKANPLPHATLSQVADHVDHLARVAGFDHIGLGGDYDGIDTVVVGMEDVSTYPALFTELARRGWSQSNLEKLSSGNMMRVMKAAEGYAAQHRRDAPLENPTAF